MTIRVEDTCSSLRDVPGGSPQGTLLGNFLFITTTDYLDEPNTVGVVQEIAGEMQDEELQSEITDHSTSRSDYLNITQNPSSPTYLNNQNSH